MFNAMNSVDAIVHTLVDRLFAAAELRLGDGASQQRVRIVRTDGRPRS